MMIHCGDPIQYANLNTSYWQSHFYAYGRFTLTRVIYGGKLEPKIQAEILDKVKAKISEQQGPAERTGKQHRSAENEEIVDIKSGHERFLSEELPLVLQRPRDSGWGQSVQKSEDKAERRKIEDETLSVMAAALCAVVLYAALASRRMPMRTAARARTRRSHHDGGNPCPGRNPPLSPARG